MSETIVTKRCSTCKKTKSLSDFYKKGGRRKGYRSQCKTCHYEASLNYQQSKPFKAMRVRYKKSEQGKAADKRYAQSKKGKASYKRYDKSKKGRARRIKYTKRYEVAHPEHIKAKTAVSHAVAKGILPKVNTLKCSCGKTAKHYHHHEGYAKEHWLDVVPVCEKCHKITP